MTSACIGLLPSYATAVGAGASGPVDVGWVRAPILLLGALTHIRTRTEFGCSSVSSQARSQTAPQPAVARPPWLGIGVMHG